MKGMIMLALLVMPMLQAIAPPARSIDKGTRSELSTARQVAISDPAAWAMLWREHAPTRPLPEVDFSREIVVGVFLGTRPSSGFAVQIVGSHEESGHLVVQYRETMPSRGDITAQVLVSPYHLVAIPKQAGMVTFEKLKT
jgi:hypothetical protein